MKFKYTEVHGIAPALRGMRNEFIPIRGHTDYLISRLGEVVGKRNKIINGRVDRCGYREIELYENGKSTAYLLHRLVMTTFAPIDGMDKLFVNHKDGNKLNNQLDNLEWCTRSENTIHSYKTGLQKVATNQHGTFTVLTEKDEYLIRSLHEKGMIDREIADVIGCSRELVGRKIRRMGLR